MKYRFKTHYSRDQARALLPHIRLWLTRILQLREALMKGEESLGRLMTPGRDVGGPEVNAWLREVADMQEVLREFQQREIQLKDLDRGLVDFPAIMDGKEVFLCWERDEDDIEFWHDLDAGYAGRERL
jgi:hypothetical protein